MLPDFRKRNIPAKTKMFRQEPVIIAYNYLLTIVDSQKNSAKQKKYRQERWVNNSFSTRIRVKLFSKISECGMHHFNQKKPRERIKPYTYNRKITSIRVK